MYCFVVHVLILNITEPATSKYKLYVKHGKENISTVVRL